MRPVRPVLAVLAVLVTAALLLVLSANRDRPVRKKYGLVFDAGSTHTALYVYQWPADKENGTGIVSQVESCTVNGSGISSYADNPAEAGASLKPCLAKAMTIIPAEQQRETPTYLGATAGMRLLREQNSTKAEQVFAEVSKAIREYPVDFRGARILTGNEEGAFGWITVNYLLETLIKYSFTGKWTQPPVEDVVGALDLGGASTQITFLPGTAAGDENTRALLRLYGTNYSVYTHSYLCYGLKEVLKRLLASLHQDGLYAQQISQPCYPKGYQENITIAEIYDSPCVPIPSMLSPAQILTVTGAGNPALCRTAILKLFNFTCGANRTCGFDGVYQPPVRGQFFAFSAFYYNLHFLNLTEEPSLSSVNDTLWKFCSRNWMTLQKDFPTRNKTHLRDSCAAGSYILTLLLQGYKFDNGTWHNIHFRKQVSNVDVGWTLGYMLNLTNMIPSETPQKVVWLPKSRWIAATVILAITVLLIFCLIAAICYWKDSSGYESL
ncbi:ectonucleoside triphosphate diphosphohydrolase 8-like isoform X1 [Excalfactoria chinensis]|uniref:ectonucleoside triphosphate diphosphohydrolase 8-like isoform X1 n=1 Tax=Excalfactoria chinensis TaxID=46218 RepID=UPI003B3AE818